MKKTNSYYRFPLMFLALAALSAALWAGWIRIGWSWNPIQPGLIRTHGPLMVSGFLGTLIVLERVVAMRQRWMIASPVLCGLGGLALMLGLPSILGAALLTLGSAVAVAILLVIYGRQPVTYTRVMAIGGVSWLVGNALWLAGWPVHRVVFLWMGFLTLTIAGERLELGRLQRLPQWSESAFRAATGLYLIGIVLSLITFDAGARLFGLGSLALAGWLLRFDIARKTIRQKGLPRFAAVCLLVGHVWLAFGGLLLMIFGGRSAGPIYDAILHTIFLGFVFSMIFGHAPIIFPAVLGLPIRFYPVFYGHLALLHLSLGVRIAADLAGDMLLRRWAGLFNGIAILIFLGSTFVSMAISRRAIVKKPKVHPAMSHGD